MKQCSKCSVVKSYEQFNKYNKASDGRQGYCKQCQSEIHKIRHKNNPARIRNYMKKWIRNNGIGVYGLWNKIEQCYDYIGEGNLNDRKNTHRGGHCPSTPWQIKLNIWFDDFDNVYEFRVLCKCKTKQQCKDTETKYINELNPRYNKNKRQHRVA